MPTRGDGYSSGTGTKSSVLGQIFVYWTKSLGFGQNLLVLGQILGSWTTLNDSNIGGDID